MVRGERPNMRATVSTSLQMRASAMASRSAARMGWLSNVELGSDVVSPGTVQDGGAAVVVAILKIVVAAFFVAVG